VARRDFVTSARAVDADFCADPGCFTRLKFLRDRFESISGVVTEKASPAIADFNPQLDRPDRRIAEDFFRPVGSPYELVTF
jgi:hypothetical protein